MFWRSFFKILLDIGNARVIVVIEQQKHQARRTMHEYTEIYTEVH